MKILCILDHFGSGGAQRQLVNLALGLKARGHDVAFFIYFEGHDFYRPLVDEAAIPVHVVAKTGRMSFRPILGLARLLRQNRYDAAISFLNTPNLYLELAGLFAPGSGRIVSERSNNLDDRYPLVAWLRRNGHRLVHQVVVNSGVHAKWLTGRHSWLRTKTTVIWNGVDVDRFAAPVPTPATPQDTRLLVVGRVGIEKNVVGVIAAMRLFYQRHGWVPQISWAGRRADHTDDAKLYLRQVDKALLDSPGIADRLSFLGERNDIPALLASHHALMLPSFYEGLPNVVCEALAAGRPVIASDISDVPALIEPGRRGFLFDPSDSASIANAMSDLVNLGLQDWVEFSRDCRDFAVDRLSNERMVEEFEQLAFSLQKTRR